MWLASIEPLARSIDDRQTQPNRVTFDWPGVTARFAIERASAVEVLINDSTPTGTRFVVSLDGPDGQFERQQIQTFETRRGVHSYPLAAGSVLAAAESVTVSLLHTQEAQYIKSGPSSNVTVLGFATDGLLKEGGPRPWRIEFIGDSITAGYGAAAAVVPCEASVFTNDFSVTYAHLLCESLRAECFIEAYSGIGMYKSFPSPFPGQRLTMPERFHDTLAGVPGGHPWRPGRDGDGWVPQAVVINLGTNDFQPGREDDPAFVVAYVDAYERFVTELAGAYSRPARGPPVFFLGVGPMRLTYAEVVETVLARLAKKGQVEAHYLDLSLAPGYEVGCDFHPAASANKAMADKALPVIAQAMGWLD
jgi:lysophospholipase L1-like esterase